MRYRDNIEWLKSLKHQIGQSQHRDLWHFEQVIDETIENLKPLAKPHGRLIDEEAIYNNVKSRCNNCHIRACAICGVTRILNDIRTAPTIIEAEVSENA